MIPVIVFKIVGILGLVFIIIGEVLRRKKQQDLVFIAGGILLTVYSVYLNDLVFIILQVVFTLIAVYDYFKKRPKKIRTYQYKK